MRGGDESVCICVQTDCKTACVLIEVSRDVQRWYSVWRQVHDGTKQEEDRKRIEEERREAEEAGDIDRIVESRAASVAASLGGAGRGRGRGRGTSNLPAWLVKKQQEENEKKDGGLHS